LYKGEADWTLIGKVKNNPRIKIPIIGNGDIDSPQKAKEYKEKYGVDAIMIGRAAIGNPWIFNYSKHYINTGELLAPPTLRERADVCIEHLNNLISYHGEKAMFPMRQHYSNYFHSLPNFKQYRIKLVTSTNLDEINDLLINIDKWYTSTGEVFNDLGMPEKCNWKSNNK